MYSVEPYVDLKSNQFFPFLFKSEQLYEVSQTHEAIEGVVEFLSRYGIAADRAHKIIEKYGEKTKSVVIRNPYVLLKHFDFLDFDSVDAMGTELLIKFNDSRRVEGLITSLLNQASRDGCCKVANTDLVNQVCDLLGVAPATAETILRRMSFKKRLYFSGVAGDFFSFLKKADALNYTKKILLTK